MIVGEVERVEVVALRLRLGADRERGAAPAARPGLPGGRSCSERLLGDLRQLAERRRVMHRQIREDLAVDLNAGLAQAVHEAVVGDLVQPRRGVDADDPQPPELAFLAPAVAVGVLRRPLDRLLGRLPQLAAPAEVALGELHHLLLALEAHDVALDARHDRSPTPAAGASSAPRRPAPPAPLCAGAASAWGASSSGCGSCTPGGGATGPTRSAAPASGAHASI